MVGKRERNDGSTQTMMKKMKKFTDERQREEEEEEEIETLDQDRLSALPKHLLLQILSLLPMKYVVRTSGLSKTQRTFWTNVPTLDFTYLATAPPCVSHFRGFVKKTLTSASRRTDSIYRFRLNFFYTTRSASLVDRCIKFATKHGAKELLIDLLNHRGRCGLYAVHKDAFTCSSLTKLKLRNCIVSPEEDIRSKSLNIHWKSLKELSLEKSVVTERAFQNILSGSPLLEFLELNCCHGFRRLDIKSTSLKSLVWSWGFSAERGSKCEILAPNLQSLKISGSLLYMSYQLVKMSSLIDAKIDLGCPWRFLDNEGHRNMFKKLFQSLCLVKQLTLSDTCTQLISELEPNEFPSFVNCKWLRLNMKATTKDSSGIEFPLHRFPNLETLIRATPYDQEVLDIKAGSGSRASNSFH